MNKILNIEELGQAGTYEDIKVKATDEQLEMIEKQHKIAKLMDYRLEEIKDLNNDKCVVVFTENRCPDAATMIPILCKLAALNEHIKLKFYETSKYECVVKRLAGEVKIPVVIFLKDDKKTVSYLYKEFPMKVREILEEREDQREFIIKEEFRMGKYNLEIQKDLIEGILSK